MDHIKAPSNVTIRPINQIVASLVPSAQQVFYCLLRLLVIGEFAFVKLAAIPLVSVNQPIKKMDSKFDRGFAVPAITGFAALPDDNLVVFIRLIAGDFQFKAFGLS